MAETRRFEGDQTWLTLRDWIKGQKASERLAGVILQSEGYLEVDPSHPLGGKDGGKDILCRKDDLAFVGAVYFPRGQQPFPDIKKKFVSDLQGVAKNNADGLVFITNQELRLGERRELEQVNPNVTIELYHLERLTLLLNVPKHYGIRLEYLGIRVTEEEYLAFLAARDEEHYRRLQEINARLDGLLEKTEQQTKNLIGYATGGDSIAYFIAFAWPNQRLDMRLVNNSQYPVFDIRGFYVDLDEPVDPVIRKMPTRHFFQVPALHSNTAVTLFPQFDMSNRERLFLSITFLTRNKKIITQQFRIVKHNGQILIAYHTMADAEMVECKVPSDFPNYNPERPEDTFFTRHAE